MGTANNALIPAAILLDNPGITKEKFVELLENTHSSWISSPKINDSIEYFEERYDSDEFKGGLEGLAEILGLEKNDNPFEEYKDPLVKYNWCQEKGRFHMQSMLNNREIYLD